MLASTNHRSALHATKPQFLLGFKHFEEKAHKAENNQNKQKIDEKMQVLWDIDFEGILVGFWKGFGRPKSMIFAFFSVFFRCRFSNVFRKAKKSSKLGQQDTESGNFGAGSDDPLAPGERQREGYKIFALHKEFDFSDLPSVIGQDVSENDFDNILGVNIKSVFLTTHFFLPHFKSNKSGTVLNIASTAGVSPRPNLTWYNASKGWMITATKGMAVELASFGIRVNAISPVAGETPLLGSFLGEDTPEMRKKFLDTIPLGRFSKPEDIGNTALFCVNA